MAIVKPSVSASGWNTATDAVIDWVNLVDPETDGTIAASVITGLSGGSASPTVHAVGNSGTTLTVNAATTGPVKTITMTGNCTFTFAAVTSGVLVTMDLLLTQDATGSRTATWPASVKWSGGTPTLSTAASARDWLTFSTPDGGTTWYGAVVGKGFA